MGYNPNPTIKPPLGSYIDWSNPLTKDLHCCSILNENIGFTCNNLVDLDVKGQIIGNYRWEEGVYLDGATSYISTTNFQFQKNITVLVKIYPFSPSTQSDVVSSWEYGVAANQSYLLMSWHSTLYTCFLINTGVAQSVSGPSTPLSANWHTLVGTYNGASLNLFIDNKLVNTVPASGTIQQVTTPMLVGARYNTTLYRLNGLINHLYIWQRTLTENDLTNIFYEPYCFINWPINRNLFYISTGIINLITSNLEQSQQIQSLVLTQDQNVSLKNILGNQELDKILVTQIQNILLNIIKENQLIDSIELLQNQNVINGNIAQNQNINDLTIDQIQNILTTFINETQDVPSVTLVSGIVLVLSAIAQSQNISLVKLLQIQNIVINLLKQNQELDLITITQIQNILEQAISQNQDISSVALNTAVVLAVSVLLQSEQLKDINVTQNQNILTDALNQQQRLIGLALTQLQNIKTSNIDETQYISAVALNLAVVLVLSAIQQNQDLYDVLIGQVQNILAKTLDQTQNLEDLTVSQLLDIVIQNLLQNSKLSDVFLKQYEAIPEPIKTLVAEFFEFIISFKP